MVKATWYTDRLPMWAHEGSGDVLTYGNLGASSDLKISGEHKPLDPMRDTGGAFLLVKDTDQGSRINRPHIPVNCGRHGSFTAGHNTSGLNIKSVIAKSEGDLNLMGATAVARTAPTNPAFDLSVAMGELRADGIPHVPGYTLWKERTQVARGAGSEFLNSEFGWIPLLNDISDFMLTVKNSEAILNQYRKGTDQKIRRRYTFPSETEYSVGPTVGVASFPAAFAPGLIGATMWSYTREIWFSGAYRYHIPTSSSQIDKFRRWGSMADHLFGVKPTPELVWNLAPWSWAADWFSNTGDVLKNISNLGRDGMVMQYGYMMCESIGELTTSATVRPDGDPRTRGMSTTRKTITKVCQRYKANPYGFGVEWESLSGTQLAVLAALGLSRS